MIWTLDELIEHFPVLWAESENDKLAFVCAVENEGVFTPDVIEWYRWHATPEAERGPQPPEPVMPPVPEISPGLREQVGEGLFGRVSDWFGIAWREFLKGFWAWIKENVTEFFAMIYGHFIAAFDEYWPPIKDKFMQLGRGVADQMNKALLSIGEVTPERASAVAVGLFGTALSMGITAHAMSVGFELVHPLKTLGFGQMTGMVAQLAAFGPLGAATLGQVHYAALRRPMSYAVNKVTRSQIPDDQLLQIMAVKPDITLEQFRETMKYHGYNDYWIDRIAATMYHEPRYFELKMMSEDEAASDDWLFEKSRRAGFNPADSKIMVSSYVKSAARTQRMDYYKQVVNQFKEGYIDESDFERSFDELELRPEARIFAAKAASLAYLYDFTKDYIKYWTDSYIKDLITDDELAVHLSLLGVVPQRVGLMVGMAKVRKHKKPARQEATELERVMSKAQTKYSQAYVALYRKGVIDLDTLEANLVALGIHPELAEATAALEGARKVE